MSLLVKIYLLTAFCSGNLYAQLSQLLIIGRPELSATEVVGTSIRDVNGRTCAALQVISDMDGFSYQANNDVMDIDDQPGKDMVYLQPDELVVEILHSGYAPLKIFLKEVGIILAEGRVWKISITGEATDTKLSITIVTDPPGAEVFIDGTSCGSAGKYSVMKGKHVLNLVKPGFQTLIENITVDEDNTFFRKTLTKSLEVLFALESEPAGATVYLDTVRLGRAPIQRMYPPGRYRLVLKKDWYKDHQETVELVPPSVQRIIKMQENFGRLTVTSSPESGQNIYLNNSPTKSITPFTFEHLPPGKYRIRTKSEQYETLEQEIVLQAGDRKTVDLHTRAVFAIMNIRTNPAARVFLNNIRLDKLENIHLAPASVVLRAEMDKALSVEKRLTLTKGESLTVELLPTPLTGSVEIAVEPTDASVEMTGDAGEYYASTGSKFFKNIPIGRYTLVVRRVNYRDWQTSFNLHADEKISKNAALEVDRDVPKYSYHRKSKKWLWICAGTAVAGGVTAVLLLQDKKDETGTLRVIIPQNP